jgi:cell wall-associated NlpC family hydrolase
MMGAIALLLIGTAAAPSEAATRKKTSPPAAKSRAALVKEALQQRGTRYRWGGASRGGFDCSGFTRYVFRTRRGLALPHSASAQARMGKPVDRTALKSGDLVFFTTYRRGISHVGIYVGSGKFVHAANSRRGVRVDSLTTGYYARRLRAARRI